MAGAKGVGLSHYSYTGDVDDGLLAGLSSFGVNKGIEGICKLGADQATPAVPADATDQATKYAAEGAIQAGNIDLTPSSSGPIADIAKAGGS